MSKKIKIAGVQLAGSADRERNLRRAGDLLDMAGARGARLAILPELWAYPWFVSVLNPEAEQYAEPVNGPLIGALSAKAAQLGLYVVVPFYELDEATGARYNSAALLDDHGQVKGVYRKVHVPQIPGWEERSYFTPGNLGFGVFETPAGKVGIQLGWDLLFPEGLRALALNGAELVVAPQAVTAANNDLWQRAAQAGAFANGLWVCRIGRVGSENGVAFSGASCCASPIGDLLSEPATGAEGISLWDIDLRAVALVRRDWPFLRDRRPEVYGPPTGKAEP